MKLPAVALAAAFIGGVLLGQSSPLKSYSPSPLALAMVIGASALFLVFGVSRPTLAN